MPACDARGGFDRGELSLSQPDLALGGRVPSLRLAVARGLPRRPSACIELGPVRLARKLEALKLLRGDSLRREDAILGGLGSLDRDSVGRARLRNRNVRFVTSSSF
ncbi:MAG: hypothetical protein ABI948_02715 [Thermoleophilia bacterium]